MDLSGFLATRTVTEQHGGKKETSLDQDENHDRHPEDGPKQVIDPAGEWPLGVESVEG
jgi:hypothetical protein